MEFFDPENFFEEIDFSEFEDIITTYTTLISSKNTLLSIFKDEER